MNYVLLVLAAAFFAGVYHLADRFGLGGAVVAVYVAWSVDAIVGQRADIRSLAERVVELAEDHERQ